MNTYSVDLKCECGGKWIESIPITRKERIIRWFKMWVSSTAQFEYPDMKIFCKKCDRRRRALEERNYVS